MGKGFDYENHWEEEEEKSGKEKDDKLDEENKENFDYSFEGHIEGEVEE